MKWFKHLVDSGSDPDIVDSVNIFGPAGYYVFFRTLELMSREFDIKNPGFVQFSTKFLRKNYQISEKKLMKILDYYQEKRRIFYKIIPCKPLPKIELNCPKLKTLTDEYTNKKLKEKSGQNPDKNSSTDIELSGFTPSQRQQITDNRLLKQLIGLCDELNLKAEKASIKFDSFVFFNNLILKNSCSIGLAIETAEGLIKGWPTMKKNPYALGTAIFKTKIQNHNEREFIEKSQQLKRDWSADQRIKSLTNGIG